MKRRRALHLVHDSPRLSPGCGGTERYVHAIAEATGDPVFTRDRNGQSRLSCDTNGNYPLWIAGIPQPKSPRFRDHFSVPELDASLDRVLSKERPDVVHIHHFAHLGFGLPQTVKARGIPVVFHLHDYQSICTRGQLVDRQLNPCSGPEETKCAWCVLEHVRARPSLHVAGRLVERFGLRASARQLVALGSPRESDLRPIRARFRATKAAFSCIDRFLSPSQNLADRMISLGWLSEEHCFVEDLPLVASIQPTPKKSTGSLRVLFVGSLIPTKGPHLLKEAVKGLPVEAHFYGPAPSFDGHPNWGEKLIAELEQQPNTHYGGIFTDDQRDQVYGDADLLVLPSTWQENSPLVLREGLAAGLPAIVSDVGGMAEIAPDAQRVQPGSVDALRTALLQAVSDRPERNPVRNWPMEEHLETLQFHYRAVQPA